MKIPKIGPKIRNVVCTANLGQKVDIQMLSKIACGIYDEAIYGGKCGYVKTPDMDGRVTIFSSGKMISIGGNSVKKAKDQLNHAKFFLVKEHMIQDTKLIPKVQNIVATIDLGKKLLLEKISSNISSANYDPQIFPGIILKSLNSCTFLIFASGKIVLTGAKSIKEVSKSLFELHQRLDKFQN